MDAILVFTQADLIRVPDEGSDTEYGEVADGVTVLTTFPFASFIMILETETLTPFLLSAYTLTTPVPAPLAFI